MFPLSTATSSAPPEGLAALQRLLEIAHRNTKAAALPVCLQHSAKQLYP